MKRRWLVTAILAALVGTAGAVYQVYRDYVVFTRCK